MIPSAGGENLPGNKPSIVCISHLAWDVGLFQRPQQIMSRLAARGHAVYYFACVGHHRHKENRHAGPVHGSPGVNVYTVPYAPGVRKFAGLRKWLAAQQISRVLRKEKVRAPVFWYYHPSLFALGYSHEDLKIVYDVMDHFPSFEKTVPDVYFDELMMLAEADVVFTGGRALQDHTERMIATLEADAAERSGGANSGKSRSTVAPVCLPSGVDLEHFGRALAACSQAKAGDKADKVFGYFGAIDERIDWEIIRAVAAIKDSRVILAGPLLISPPQLPSNVKLPGPIPYAELPILLAGFDVCMIPFRNTSLVQYVSPTKTPEYLAGGKPVVSTPVPDVMADYKGIVAIGNTPEDFAAACERMATGALVPEELAAEAAGRARTWEQIADEMEATIFATVSDRSETGEMWM